MATNYVMPIIVSCRVPSSAEQWLRNLVRFGCAKRDILQSFRRRLQPAEFIHNVHFLRYNHLILTSPTVALTFVHFRSPNCSNNFQIHPYQTSGKNWKTFTRMRQKPSEMLINQAFALKSGIIRISNIFH